MEENLISEKKEEITISGKKSNKSETGYGKIFLTALLTAILTSSTQYLLQSSKLLEEHDFWRKRYEIEKVDKVNSNRLLLLDDLNKELLQLEVKVKEIKIKAVISNYSITSEEIKELTELLVQYQEDFYLCAAKIQMASLYFGDEVDSLIPKLEQALQLNFQNNLLLKDSGLKLPEYELDFETMDTLTTIRHSLAKAMINEIYKSYGFKVE